MKKIITSILITVIVLIIAGVVAVKIVGKQGSSRLEHWIGTCITGVLGSYLTPDIKFNAMDYQAPYTVIIDNLTMTTRNVQQLEVTQMILELAEIPKVGKPIQIKRIELQSPTIKFVKGSDEDAGFVGWTDLVKTEVIENPNSVEAGNRISDVLAMRYVVIRDGKMVYDLSDGSDPMILQGMELSLNTEPQTDISEPGWYSVDTKIKREKLFDIKVDGRFNIDNIFMDLAKLNLSASLSADNYSIMPPEIQTYLKQYDIHGMLSVDVNGLIPLTDFTGANMQINVLLENGNIAVDDKILPIERFETKASLSSNVVNAVYEMNLLAGSIMGNYKLFLATEAMPLELDWIATGIQIQNTLKAFSDDSNNSPAYAGTIDMTGKLFASAANFFPTLSGNGELNLTEGKLMVIPVLSKLASVVNPSNSDSKSGLLEDTAQVLFQILPDRVHIDSLKYSSSLVAAHGDGDVFFNTDLSLKLNAGPMEKIQDNLGKIGDLLGKITDSFVKYYVSGTVAEPEVSVKPLGIGADG